MHLKFMKTQDPISAELSVITHQRLIIDCPELLWLILKPGVEAAGEKGANDKGAGRFIQIALPALAPGQGAGLILSDRGLPATFRFSSFRSPRGCRLFG